MRLMASRLAQILVVELLDGRILMGLANLFRFVILIENACADSSHISKVAVFTQYNSKSLTQHLSSSKWWDFGRKQGGLYVKADFKGRRISADRK